MISILEIIEVPSGKVTEVLRHPGRIEAPNWSPSGDWLLVNGEGRLWRVPLSAPKLEAVDTGPATSCNNDHGLTPDGQTIILSSHHEGQGSQIYTMPMDGGPLTRVSPQAPSWWHAVSPNGARLAYAAARGGGRIVDIYTLPLAGGDEVRLTFGEGHSDGPDYSPDGKRIYWNCDRPGAGGTRHAQIWVMDTDGRNQRQLFADDRVNWFPHPSPCGQWLAYLSYPPGTVGHPPDLAVELVLCDPEGRDRRILHKFTGGQGTINVPSWAPDGLRFAAMRYEV